jgi:hypothetical protein
MNEPAAWGRAFVGCFAAAAIATMIAMGCASDGRSPDPATPPTPPTPPTMPPTKPPDDALAVLTLAVPAQELQLPAPQLPPMALRLDVTAIHNPAAQGFTLRATLIVGSTTGSEPAVSFELGSVAPYPAERPGRFSLPISEAIRLLLEGPARRAVLRVQLEPIASERPLVEPLRVTLGAPGWLGEQL